MPFLNNVTGSVEVDASIIHAYQQGILVENDESVRLEQFVDTKVDIGAKSITFTKYSKLPKATTPLNQYEDIPRVQLVDSDIVITPVEYGTAVTTTRLASLQTGGKVDLAKVKQIGQSLARTTDQLIVDALMSAPGARITSGAVGGTSLAALRLALAKRHVPTYGGSYVALMNEDAAEVLRNEAGWVDVAKYDNAINVLRAEIGMYKGMRVVTHSDVPDNTIVGIGAGAIAKAVSENARFFVGNPDSAARFADMGWTGVFKYDLLDIDNLQIVTE